MSDMQEESEKASGNGASVILLLFLAIAMVSSGSVLIKLSHSPKLVVVFWRTFYGAIVMATLGAFRGNLGEYRSPVIRQNWKWLIAVGVLLSLHFATWFESLNYTTIAASVALVNLSPIFTAILSTIVLGEALRRKSWVGVAVAVLGAALLGWSDLVSQGPEALTGDLLALAGAVFLALYFIGGRRFAKGLPITVYTSAIYAVAAGATLVLCMVFGYNVLVFETREVLLFLALAIFPTALGHSVLNYLLTKVPAYVVSSAALGEPIGATILAILIFGPVEIPTTLTWIGFAIILLGVALILADSASRETRTPLPLDDANRSQSNGLSSDTDLI